MAEASNGWVDRSPIGQLSRELDRLIVIEAAYHQAYGVAWSLGVIRCTSAEKELENAKARVAT